MLARRYGLQPSLPDSQCGRDPVSTHTLLMTTANTLLASILMPLLSRRICGSIISVSASSFFLSTAKVVILPVLLGVLLNAAPPGLSRRVSRYAPFSSVVHERDLRLRHGEELGEHRVARAGPVGIRGPAALPGSLFGARLPRYLGSYGWKVSRTILIETGMQNSALACVLANSLEEEEAAIPRAISGTVNCCLESGLAAVWRWMDGSRGGDDVD